MATNSEVDAFLRDILDLGPKENLKTFLKRKHESLTSPTVVKKVFKSGRVRKRVVGGPHWSPAAPLEVSTAEKSEGPKKSYGECKRCGEKARLQDYLMREGPPKLLWCWDCAWDKFALLVKKASEESKKTQALLATSKSHGEGTRRRPSLTPEGNVPLMVRLLKEGKTKKEQRAVFRELYHKLGRKDEKFILSRVKLYRARAQKKLEGGK